MKRGNVKALLPIGVFLILYLGLGILFEYGLQIPMGFYNIPIVVAFLAALLVACLQNRALSLDDKLLLLGKGVGDKIIIMSYAHMTPEEIARGYHPNVVFVDEENQVARVTAYEKHGLLKDMA